MALVPSRGGQLARTAAGGALAALSYQGLRQAVNDGQRIGRQLSELYNSLRERYQQSGRSLRGPRSPSPRPPSSIRRRTEGSNPFVARSKKTMPRRRVARRRRRVFRRRGRKYRRPGLKSRGAPRPLMRRYRQLGSTFVRNPTNMWPMRLKTSLHRVLMIPVHPPEFFSDINAAQSNPDFLYPEIRIALGNPWDIAQYRRDGISHDYSVTLNGQTPNFGGGVNPGREARQGWGIWSSNNDDEFGYERRRMATFDYLRKFYRHWQFTSGKITFTVESPNNPRVAGDQDAADVHDSSDIMPRMYAYTRFDRSPTTDFVGYYTSRVDPATANVRRLRSNVYEELKRNPTTRIKPIPRNMLGTRRNTVSFTRKFKRSCLGTDQPLKKYSCREGDAATERLPDDTGSISLGMYGDEATAIAFSDTTTTNPRLAYKTMWVRVHIKQNFVFSERLQNVVDYQVELEDHSTNGSG